MFILVGVIAFYLVTLASKKWALSGRLGVVYVMVYVAFIAYTLMKEFNVIF